MTGISLFLFLKFLERTDATGNDLIKARIIYRREHVGEPRLRPRGRQVRNGVPEESRDSSPAKHKRPAFACIAQPGASAASPGTASSTGCVPAPVIHLPSVERATRNVAVRTKQEQGASAVARQHSPNDSQD